MRAPLSFSLLTILVMGCSPATETYRWKQGASYSLLSDDFANCKFAAARDVPVNTQVGQTPIYQTPIQTICKPGATAGETICTTTGGDIQGGEIYTYDANRQLRGDFLARCMAKRGYSAASVAACPTKVVPADISAIVRLGLRPPKEGACAISLQSDTSLILYPEEFR